MGYGAEVGELVGKQDGFGVDFEVDWEPLDPAGTSQDKVFAQAVDREIGREQDTHEELIGALDLLGATVIDAQSLLAA